MTEHHLHNKSTVVAKPITPSKHETICMNPFDNLAPATSFHFQFVYENSGANQNFMEPHKLLSSLSSLLVEFPILAGTAHVDDGRWSVECNDAGVPVTIAHSKLELSDFSFGDYDQQPRDIHTQWMSPTDPVWQVQITYFRCGGVILISELFHMLGDGETHSNLMKKWSNIYNSKSIVRPVLDRTMVRSSGGLPPSEFPQWHQSQEVIANYEHIFSKLPLCTSKLIVFTKDELITMKARCTKTNSWVSTNDALCSHMWRLIVRARNTPQDHFTSLLHSYNIRKRVQPAICSDYVGYLVYSAQSEHVLVRNLLDNDLSHCASISRKTVDDITPDKVQRFIDWIHVTSKSEVE
ncbi:shikimate O-hydroxycinnamoyltransferase [Acrasis kona]|uniref:Shikimate O-hydroxycinnamoyltransferase n=1 Tax=Acrasis kona TaxID=1008807 RepID=A0AAW2YMM6_9EUKA